MCVFVDITNKDICPLCPVRPPVFTGPAAPLSVGGNLAVPHQHLLAAQRGLVRLTPRGARLLLAAPAYVDVSRSGP